MRRYLQAISHLGCLLIIIGSFVGSQVLAQGTGGTAAGAGTGSTTTSTTATTAKPEFKAILKVTQNNGNIFADISWNYVEGATHYTIARAEIPDQFITVKGSQNHFQISDVDKKVRAEDKYIVKAIYAPDVKPPLKQEITVMAETTASSADVVRAPTEFGPVANIGEYAKRILKYALPLGIALSVLTTIYAGITLMVSQGSPDKIKAAQEMIQGAVFGLATLIFARAIADFLLLPSIN